MQVKVGTVAFLEAAGVGYLVGLDDDGHRVEALPEWSALADLRESARAGDAVHVHVQDWQVLSIDGAVHLPRDEAAIRRRRHSSTRR
jgi:hypothetical protein